MCYDRGCLPKNILVWEITWEGDPNAFIAQRSSKHILTLQINLLSHAKAYLSTPHRLVEVRLVVRSMLPLVTCKTGNSNSTCPLLLRRALEPLMSPQGRSGLSKQRTDHLVPSSIQYVKKSIIVSSITRPYTTAADPLSRATTLPKPTRRLLGSNSSTHGERRPDAEVCVIEQMEMMENPKFLEIVEMGMEKRKK